MKFKIKRVSKYIHPNGLVFRKVWVLSCGGKDILVSANPADIDAAIAAGGAA